MKKYSMYLLGLGLLVLCTGCPKMNQLGPSVATVANNTTMPTVQPTSVVSPITSPTVVTSTTPTTPVPTTVPTTAVPTATPMPTNTPVPTIVVYMKVTGDSPSLASTFVCQLWTRVLGVNTDVFNGTATIDSSNGYVWQSVNSNGYPSNGASANFNVTAPANQGLYIEIHSIKSGIDTIRYSSHPLANQSDGASFSF